MTDAVVAALGWRSLATAGGVGEGGEGPVPAPPPEAGGRRDFYSDTASARLCLVMVTCARSAPPSAPPPPGQSDGGAAAWATEAEPERGHGGVSERPAPGLRARRAGSAPAAVPGGRGTRRRGPGGLGGYGGPPEGQEGAAPVPSFCWTVRLAGWPGNHTSRTRGPGSAAPTEAPGPRGVGGLDLRPGIGSRGRGGVASSLFQASVAAQASMRSPSPKAP